MTSPAHPIPVSRRSDAIVFLQWLLIADALFIGLHLVHVYTPALPETVFSLHQEEGHSETWMHLKEFWIAAALVLAYRRMREGALLAWGALFAWILLDDSMRLHERGGAWMAETLSLPAPAGLRAQDLGELAVWSIAGTVLLGAILFTYLRTSRPGREITHDLLLLFALLIGFGVGVDILHSVVRIEALGPLLGLLEDGGEMVVVSVIVFYVFQLPRALERGAGFRPAGMLIGRLRQQRSRFVRS